MNWSALLPRAPPCALSALPCILFTPSSTVVWGGATKTNSFLYFFSRDALLSLVGQDKTKERELIAKFYPKRDEHWQTAVE